MEKLLKGYLIDVNKRTHGAVVIRNDLDDIYRLLGVDCVDIVTRSIGCKNYTVIADDTGLLKPYPLVSASNFSLLFPEFLVGSILITNTDENGDLESLSEKDIWHIALNVRKSKSSPTFAAFVVRIG